MKRHKLFLLAVFILSFPAISSAQSPSECSQIGPSSAKITWQGCSDNDNAIRFRKSGTEEWIINYIGNDSYFKLSGLKPKTQYEYQVKTCLAEGKTTWSPVEKFLTVGRPNLLVIVVDDGRYDNYSANGGPDFFQTPNIDRIANEGVKFKYCFPSLSLCSPSRASIVTGLYPHNNGVVRNGFSDSLTIPTVATILHDSGYYTGFVGKYGFDKFPIPGYDYWIESSSNDYWNSQYNYNGDITYIPGHKTNILTQKAVEFLDEVPADQPFCLLLEHKAPHVPLEPRKEDSNLYKTDTMPYPESFFKYAENYPDYYYDCHNFIGDTDSVQAQYLLYYQLLAGVEWSVGILLDKLEDEGILDSTLVMFTSDNGLLKGEHLMSGKQVAQEEAIRLPMFIRYPAWFNPNTFIEDEMAMNIDIAPTLIDAAGFINPTPMDGWSMHDLVTGDKHRKEFLFEFFNKEECTPTMHAIRSFEYKYIYNSCDNVTEEFYDLVNDTFELTNLINTYSYQALIQEYREKLDSIRIFYGDTVWVDTVINCHLENITTAANVEDDPTGLSVSVSPNPGGNIALLTWSAGSGDDVDIIISDLMGQTVLQRNYASQASKNHDELNLQHWPNGIYFISVRSGKEQQIVKYVKQE